MGVRETVGHDAVELFVMRARESDPGFHLSDENARAIAEMCVRLDGLPLAIELAAARVPHLAPAAIVERLAERRPVLTAGRRDLPARQRTLADAIDWSYELLSARRATPLAPAERLSGRLYGARRRRPSPTPRAISTSVSGLASLTDKSLLVRQAEGAHGMRFTMLETIREYGLERLAASGEEAAVREAHAAYFLAFAEQAARDFQMGAGQRAAIGRLEEENDNLRQALAWALEQADPTTALRLTYALWRFWWIQGQSERGAALARARAGAEPGRATGGAGADAHRGRPARLGARRAGRGRDSCWSRRSPWGRSHSIAAKR